MLTEPHITTNSERSTQASLTRESGHPKNVILLIGDGMGMAQISAGMYINGNSIAFERMPVVGLHKNYSYDDLVTDSAAGATAFSCGVKTYNGAIGVRPDTSACPTILEWAHEQGMATGLVATSTIVHATPASFFAHEASRQSYEAIASQLVDSPVDFFIGGGAKFFSGRTVDQRNLVSEMQALGRTVDTYFEKSILEIQPDPEYPYGYITALEDPLPVAQGRDYLPKASELAIAYLSAKSKGDSGFFLMIEGSQIDWGGHANNTDYIISETIEFSEVVNKVLDFAAKNGETLVVVTADHETGGFAINVGSTFDKIEGAFTTIHHTGEMIPVFAYGPGANNFSGIFENTAIYSKLLTALQSSK